MAGPLDQVTYDNSPQYFIWKSFQGNYENMVITFPFDITDYEFSGEVINEFGTQICTITTNKLITGTVPSIVYKVENIIPQENVDIITPNCTYRLKWIQSGLYPKTYIAGPIEVGK